MTDFGFSEILELANVRIDTKIKSVACIQPEIRKVIQLICVTLSSKVNRQGHIIFLTYLISSISKMLESTPRLTWYHVYNRRWERSCKKVFDLDFQGHAIKIEFFIITVGFLDPENIPMRNIFKKFGREGKIQGGLYQPPLGVFRLAKYLGHLRVNELSHVMKWFRYKLSHILAYNWVTCQDVWQRDINYVNNTSFKYIPP